MPGTTLSTSAALPDRRCFDDFVVEIRHTGSCAVVAVAGDIDVSTASSLRIHLDAVADEGTANIVLDLAHVTFFGAAGLGIVATVAARLRAAGGGLTLRRPSAQMVRLLEITTLIDRVEIDRTVAAADLSADLVHTASRSTRNDVIEAELLQLVAVASVAVKGADGVSVTLERDGRMATVAASNDTVLRMDAHQYATGEGPCLAAAADGVEFHIESLAADDRWPAFVPLAMGEGIASILSSPLLVGGRSIGALNLYSGRQGAFEPPQHELAAIFAGQVARIVTDAQAELTDPDMGARIAAALQSREVLAHAQGILMGRHRVSAIAATSILNRAARTAGLSVLDYASSVVRSTSDDDEIDRRGHG